MSNFYKPNRNSNWNFGGPNWRLSRSKIDLFLECPKCFYLDNKLGVARPPGFPFNLNAAVDKLLKKEFDIHRFDKTAHPLMKNYGIDAVPFAHKDLDTWRDNFKGVQYFYEPTGMTISGAVDDIWINPAGELFVVDYKATSKESEVNLDADWQKGYKRQMEVYQWLLRKNGFKVSNTGYFVYVNGRTDREAFDGKLEFDVKIIPYEGKDSWIEKTIETIHKCLLDDRVPSPSKDCDYCAYRQAVSETLSKK
jgi:CRISPR/Cas system-associated exonuclease Cas4 (RecB family)